MQDTIDEALAPINESINKAKVYSPDNMINNDVVERTIYSDNNVVSKVDHGNGVATMSGAFYKKQNEFGGELLKIGSSTIADIAYEAADVFTDANESFNNLLLQTHPLIGYTAYQVKNVYENKMDAFQPQTDLGKTVRDIASELSIMGLNLVAFKKIRFLQGVPKYGQKAKKYFMNLAKSALRWGTAEGIAAGIARDNESEPFALMLTDITGITDKEDLKNIRLLYQDALKNGDDFNDFRLRGIKALDGLATGATIEVLMTVLGSTFKAHQALFGTSLGTTGSVIAAGTAEQQKTKDTLIDYNNDQIIKKLFHDDLTIGPYDD